MGRKDYKELANTLVACFEALLERSGVTIPSEDRDADDNASLCALDRQELESEVLSEIEDFMDGTVDEDDEDSMYDYSDADFLGVGNNEDY